ncbi:hypothetical protein F4679DRAFT_578343 [Xylaria curta]|nr:hypothetical protein F4679DRAFT_578343 [Xylaria curta]
MTADPHRRLGSCTTATFPSVLLSHTHHIIHALTHMNLDIATPYFKLEGALEVGGDVAVGGGGADPEAGALELVEDGVVGTVDIDIGAGVGAQEDPKSHSRPNSAYFQSSILSSLVGAAEPRWHPSPPAT